MSMLVNSALLAATNTDSFDSACGQRLDVAGRLAARAFEHRPAAQFADHAVRLLDPERRDAEGHVAQYLDKDAAESEHHDRAEHRIVLHAEDHLDAAPHHRRDQARRRAWRAARVP